MDPGSRRFIWSTLQAVVASGRSIVLTSHSMEECEALCTRIAIMVNGTFKCLGSVQHIKSKYRPLKQTPILIIKLISSSPLRFGAGYRLVLKVPTTPGVTVDTEPVKKFVVERFPNSKLAEEHTGELIYEV